MYYDLSICQSFNLIYISDGLCVNPLDDCSIESVGTITTTTNQQIQSSKNTEVISNENAIEVCNLYLSGAMNITQMLNMTFIHWK